MDSQSKQPLEGSKGRAVHQFVARLAWGDAVGNQVRYVQQLLRAWGFRSDIYADQWDEACREQVRPASRLPSETSRRDVLLVHHSFQSRCVPVLRRTRARQALVYHNITPSRLFEGFDRKVAAACDAARDELREMQGWMERAYAYSRFSAEELVAAGYENVSVLPFALDWRAFDVPPDETLKAELNDGCTNILFVGRAVPSKRIDDVMRVFAAYQALYQPRSRLVVAGYLNRETPYGAYLYGVKELLGAERVRLLGRVSAAQLSACYASATVYLSMSRHEGFGVPLLEAMHRDVPVVAYGAAAVPETMGGAGIALRTNEPEEVARLLAVLERRPDLRRSMVEGQRARLRELEQEKVAEQIREQLTPLLTPTTPLPLGEGRGEGARQGAPTQELNPFPRIPASAQVELVCPDYERAPGAPLSQLARNLLKKLPNARILTLSKNPEPESPDPSNEEHIIRFTPDQPLPAAKGEALPGSTSLEALLRRSRGRMVFLGPDSEVARVTLPHVRERAWAVQDAKRPAPSPIQAERLLTLDEQSPETTLNALVEALTSQRRTHAGE